MGHRVTAPAVVITDTAGQVRYFYRGAVLPDAELPGAELDRLVGAGLLAAVDDDTAAAAEPEPEPAPRSARAPAGAGEPPARPAQVAPKAAWVGYAVARGADAAEAEKATKPELIERYGGG